MQSIDPALLRHHVLRTNADSGTAPLQRLPHFPKPFLDETIYSLVARFHRLLGNAGFSATYQMLFGRPHTAFASVFAGLAQLFLRIPKGVFSVDTELVLSHANLPLRQSFESPASFGNRVARALNNEATGVRELSAGTHSVWLPRMCMECRDEDFAQRGTSYWRRTHQFSGLQFCPRHSRRLVDRCQHCDAPLISGVAFTVPGTTCRACGAAHPPSPSPVSHADDLSINLSAFLEKWLHTPALPYQMGAHGQTILGRLSERGVIAGAPTYSRRAVASWLIDVVPHDFVRSRSWAHPEALARALRVAGTSNELRVQPMSWIFLAMLTCGDLDDYRNAYLVHLREPSDTETKLPAPVVGESSRDAVHLRPIVKLDVRESRMERDARYARKIEEIAPSLYRQEVGRSRITRSLLCTRGGIPQTISAGAYPLATAAITRWIESTEAWNEAQLFCSAATLVAQGRRITPMNLCKGARIHHYRIALARQFLVEFPALAS